MCGCVSVRKPRGGGEEGRKGEPRRRRRRGGPTKSLRTATSKEPKPLLPPLPGPRQPGQRPTTRHDGKARRPRQRPLHSPAPSGQGATRSPSKPPPPGAGAPPRAVPCHAMPSRAAPPSPAGPPTQHFAFGRDGTGQTLRLPSSREPRRGFPARRESVAAGVARPGQTRVPFRAFCRGKSEGGGTHRDKQEEEEYAAAGPGRPHPPAAAAAPAAARRRRLAL